MCCIFTVYFCRYGPFGEMDCNYAAYCCVFLIFGKISCIFARYPAFFGRSTKLCCIFARYFSLADFTGSSSAPLHAMPCMLLPALTRKSAAGSHGTLVPRESAAGCAADCPRANDAGLQRRLPDPPPANPSLSCTAISLLPIKTKTRSSLAHRTAVLRARRTGQSGLHSPQRSTDPRCGRVYCSICLPRKPAAVSAIFTSIWPIFTCSSLFVRITDPIGSPPAMIGAMT
mgnify:CR=1 FL=1